MSSDERESLFTAPYRVTMHEHVDDDFANVTVRCLGFPSAGAQPVEWPFVLKVPKADLAKWPLGASVRLSVTA